MKTNILTFLHRVQKEQLAQCIIDQTSERNKNSIIYTPINMHSHPHSYTIYFFQLNCLRHSCEIISPLTAEPESTWLYLHKLSNITLDKFIAILCLSFFTCKTQIITVAVQQLPCSHAFCILGNKLTQKDNADSGVQFITPVGPRQSLLLAKDPDQFL